MSAELDWLRDLASVVRELPTEAEPRSHFSQREARSSPAADVPLATAVRRVRTQIRQFEREQWFSERLGFDCVDGDGDTGHTIEAELDERLGKGHLISLDDAEWSLDDLCDVIEVYHDLAARPAGGRVHTFMGCGLHPAVFARECGRAVYRWRMNRILAGAALGLRLADSGADIGRITRILPSGIDELATHMTSSEREVIEDVAHGVALYRGRHATRDDRRSAIVALARVLEARRALLKAELFSGDERALFEIANKFDLRHNKATERRLYDEAFLDWIFHWYLATIELTDRMLQQQATRAEDG